MTIVKSKQKSSPEMAGIAEQRAVIYGLLAAVYRQEPSIEFLRFCKKPETLDVLSDLGLNFGPDFLSTPEEDLLETLAVEFTRIFLGPGKHVSPHESVHHERSDDKWGELWGAATAEFKQLVESTGLELDKEFYGIPDHISVELEFMQILAKREKAAWQESDHKTVADCNDTEQTFLEEHLAPWVPGFCDKVSDYADHPFYIQMAELTKNFIAFEVE